MHELCTIAAQALFPTLAGASRDAWYLAAPVVLCLYYLAVWIAIGRPLPTGTAVIRYEPPPGVSAAAARYLFTTGSDGRSLAAVIAALAAHRVLSVEPCGKVYKISRLLSDLAAERDLAPEEKHALQFLFEDGPVAELSPTVTQKNNLRLSRYVTNIQSDLVRQLGSAYFTRHLGYVVFGAFASFAAVCLLALSATGRDKFDMLFMTVWIFFIGLTLGGVIETGFLPAAKNALKGSARWTPLLPGFAAFAVFGAAMALLFSRLARGISPAYAAMLATVLLVNLAWAPRLKRMTPHGRATLDALLGFRKFLETVEQDRLARLNAPGDAPSAETQYLPYAIALEVREAWGDHLASAFFASTIARS